MASPTEAKTTSTATSPPTIAPTAPPSYPRQQSICIKPAALAASPASPSIQTQNSVTSKEWIIPPRPKPGRKPATDTPPTKRKAQNRAAQRAFRERRAARVGELEEQIKQIEEDDEREQDTLKAQIAELSANLEHYRSQMNMWMERNHALEKELTEERRQREAILQELSHLQNRQSAPSQSSTQPTPVHDRDDSEIVNRPIGCGGCSTISRCECVESAVDMSNVSEQAFSLAPKRPQSPRPQNSAKRVKAEPVDEPMELDFTHSFARPTKPQDTSPTSAVADPCGFCQNGTPCICAEMAVVDDAPAKERSADYRAPAPMASARQLAQFTPPPSDGDVAPVPPAMASGPSGSCQNGAGTCAQCQADPNSTLFCKALAAARTRSLESAPTTPTGCCGGSRNGSSCYQNQLRSLPPPMRRSQSQVGVGTVQRDGQSPSSAITLSCADAYTTLSRHPAYERAISSGDVGSWMPKLYASSSQDLNDLEHKRHETVEARARPAMEIEVANVMSVLREFDRRFGSSA